MSVLTEYVHSINICNVSLNVSGSDYNTLDILEESNMNFYAQIPFASINGENVESKLMFQHIPKMTKDNEIIIPENISYKISYFDTEKCELDDVIELDNGYSLIRAKAFQENNIDIDNVFCGHMIAMQDRDRFTIPLGEDKYMLQKYNGDDALLNMLMNYSYVLVNESYDYGGFINILRSNANTKNAEIEIGIDPTMQHDGLGSMVINSFYKELFSTGYASVTSAVFEFNEASLNLHKKMADFNGIRLSSYYINGRLCDMHYYTKVNNLVTDKDKCIKKVLNN